MNIKNIGLSTSAFGYSMGNTGKDTDRKNPRPWSIEAFVLYAKDNGFGGVEAPLMRFIPDLHPERLSGLRSLIEEHDMFFILDLESPLEREAIERLIPVAQAFGSPIIRVKSSSILGLARKNIGQPWREHIEHCIAILEELGPTLRENGLKIAIENHQDLDSNDLKEIVDRAGKDIVGVNFDIGNAFASCEDPVEFAHKIGDSILNIHLKDYKIVRSPEGFLLARCPLGSGAVDWNAILPLLSNYAPDARMVVELGAQDARNIAWLSHGFWDEIQPRSQRELISFFQQLEKSVRADDATWKTAWEEGRSGEEVAASERDELEKSVHFMSTL